MQNIVYLFLLSLFSLNLFASNVSLTEKERRWLEVHPTIVLGSDSTWEPNIIKNPDGTITGYDADVLNLINEKTGANFKLVAGSWSEMVQKAKNKEIDGLSSSAVHLERKEFFNFSQPYVSTNKVMVISKTNPSNIYSLKDLDGKKIGYQDKNLFDQKLASQFKNSILVPLQDYKTLIKDLVKGKIDATVGSYAFLYLAQKMGLQYITILDEIPNSKFELVFSVRKDYPLAVSILNKGIDSLSAEEKSRLANKWFFEKSSEVSTSSISLTKEEKDYLHKHPTLNILGLDSYPPFNFTQNGQSLGYSIDYMKLMGKYLNVDINIKGNISWKKALEMIKKGELDIIPHIAKSDDRKKYITYTNFNHIEYTTGLALKKGTSIASVKDLENKRLAVVENSFLHTFLKEKFPNLTLLIVHSTFEALKAVSSSRAEVAIGSLPTFDYYIQRDWLSNLVTQELENTTIPLKTALPMGVAKNNLLLKSILEKTEAVMPPSEVSKLRIKWMNQESGFKSIKFSDEELAYLKQKKEITMCVDPHWMPYEKIEKGKYIGMSADYMRLFEKMIGTPISLISTHTWAESLQFVQERKCDILPLAVPTDERKKYLHFTDPFLHVPIVIATGIKQPFVNDISNIANKKIGIVKGYPYGVILKEKYPNIDLVEVDNESEGLQKVNANKLFGLIGGLATIGYNIQQNYIGELKIAGKFEETWDLGVGTRKDEPMLRDIFNKTIANIPPETHQEILNKWIIVNFDRSIDYKNLIYLSLLFLLVTSILFYKNRSINKINKELKRANQKIEEQQQMVDEYVLITETDLEGVITNVNRAFCNSLGYDKSDLVGKTFEGIKNPQTDEKIYADIWKTITADKTWSGEISNYTKARVLKHFFININSIYQNETKVGYRAILEDITDKKEIEKLSITDRLTGIYNRLKLDALLVKQVETNRRYDIPFSVILLDIDNFKKINDTFGHDKGDYVLQKIANIFKENVRKTDLVGRWGGEEFLIICPNTIGKNAKIVTEHIRLKIEEEHFDTIGSITTSAGVTEYKESESIEHMLKRADIALYDAKKNGKNQSIFL